MQVESSCCGQCDTWQLQVQDVYLEKSFSLCVCVCVGVLVCLRDPER